MTLSVDADAPLDRSNRWSPISRVDLPGPDADDRNSPSPSTSSSQRPMTGSRTGRGRAPLIFGVRAHPGPGVESRGLGSWMRDEQWSPKAQQLTMPIRSTEVSLPHQQGQVESHDQENHRASSTNGTMWNRSAVRSNRNTARHALGGTEDRRGPPRYVRGRRRGAEHRARRHGVGAVWRRGAVGRIGGDEVVGGGGKAAGQPPSAIIATGEAVA